MIHAEESLIYQGPHCEGMSSPSTGVERPLDKDELLDILKFRVRASWHREFTVQGFNPVDQGLRKFVEFCTRLESCEPNEDKPKIEKTGKTWGRKRKAKVLTMPTATTTATANLKYYYKLHGPNRTQNTKKL
eukprot:13939308-Ditylum_brightwellii.AAC.1